MYNVDKIFELLKERKLEQKDLAKAIGVSAGNITEWKKGRAKPSANVIPKIADYFKLPLSDFYVYDTDNTPPPEKDDTVPANEEMSYIFVMGAGGTHQKIPIPKEKLEKFNKMVELIMPELLNDDKNNDL